MSKYNFLNIFLLAVITYIAIVPLRAYPLGHEYSSVGGFLAFFFLTFYFCKRFDGKISAWKIVLLIILGHWIFELPIRIKDFMPTLGTLPDSLFRTIGILCGYLSYKIKTPARFAPFVLGCLLTVYMFFQGYDLWANKLIFGTFTGRVEAYALPAKFEALDEQKNIITENDFNGKIVLLDFWFTRCGGCFEEFPQVQAAYDKFKNDPSVKILAVDKPIDVDKPGEAFKVIREKGYTFPVVVASDEELPEKLGVKAYPTVLVIDLRGKIVYRGDIEWAALMVDELRSGAP